MIHFQILRVEPHVEKSQRGTHSLGSGELKIQCGLLHIPMKEQGSEDVIESLVFHSR